MQAGEFRRDLYYRLNVRSLHIPPLRDRKEDLPELTRAGLERLSQSLGLPVPRISDDFYEHLTGAHRPARTTFRERVRNAPATRPQAENESATISDK